MYKNKIACCKQLSAEVLNSSFLAVSKILQSGRNKAKSRDTQSLCPSSVCTQTPIQTSLSHTTAVPGLPGSALWSQTDAWTLASTQVPHQTSASSSCEQPCNLPPLSETKGYWQRKCLPRNSEILQRDWNWGSSDLMSTIKSSLKFYGQR